MKTTYHGMQIVPQHGENQILYGGFSGLVIADSGMGFNFIELVRVSSGVRGSKTYYIPYREAIDHSNTSGAAKADFLYNEALKYAKANESIAVTESIEAHLRELDTQWEKFQLLMKMDKK